MSNITEGVVKFHNFDLWFLSRIRLLRTYAIRVCLTCMLYINVSRYSITYHLQPYPLHAFGSTFTLAKNTNKMKSKLKRFTIHATDKCVEHNTQLAGDGFVATTYIFHGES